MKWVIPAAWYGTRMLPITKTIPKEMLPIGNKPVIQYIVEWFVWAGITDIALITSQGKSSLEDYFDKNYELEQILLKKWKDLLLDEINKPKTMANYVFMKQKEQLWLPDAILQAKSRISDEYFFVCLWDQFGDPRIYKNMIETHKKTGWTVIWLQEMPDEELHKYWVAAVDDEKIISMVEKPQPWKAPSNLVSNGLYILPHSFFDIIETTEVDKNTWEIVMPDCLLKLQQQEPLYTHTIQYSFRDAWTPETWLQAVNETFSLWLRK